MVTMNVDKFFLSSLLTFLLHRVKCPDGPQGAKSPFPKGPQVPKEPPRVFCLFLSNNDVTMEIIGCKLKTADLYCYHYHQHDCRCDLQAVVKHQAKITFFLQISTKKALGRLLLNYINFILTLHSP